MVSVRGTPVQLWNLPAMKVKYWLHAIKIKVIVDIKKDSFVGTMSVHSNNKICLVSQLNFTKCFWFIVCCRSHSVIDVTGVGSESPFAVSESCKIVDDTIVIVHESDNEHEISDTDSSTSSSEQSCDRYIVSKSCKQMDCKWHSLAVTSILTGRILSHSDSQ